MKMTNEMVKSFNEYIGQCDTKIRLEYRESGYLPVIDIVTTDLFLTNDSVPNLKKEFHQLLEQFFLTKFNTILLYNNTRTTFWNKD